MKSNSMVKDLTNGSVPKLLFAFAAPLFVGAPKLDEVSRN
jgi:hypothetical protein